MAVFEIFAREKRELSNSDVARLLSVAESSCSDLLHTLHTLGYLIRTPKTRRFYPSGRLYEAVRQIAEKDPLMGLAQEAVDQVTEKTNESAFFGMLDGSSAKIVAAQQSRQPMRYYIDVGTRIAMHSTSLGKALLGLMPPDELHAKLESIRRHAATAKTIVDVDKLVDDIRRSRERQWYEGHEEASEGVSGLAVSGWLGTLPVALSIGGLSNRINRNREDHLRALFDVRDALLTSTEDPQRRSTPCI